MNAYWILQLFTLTFGLLFCATKFQQLHLANRVCGKSILNHDIIGKSTILKSKIECGARCLITKDCKVILYERYLDRGDEGMCSLIRAPSAADPYIVADNSSMCFMVDDGISVLTSEELTTITEMASTTETSSTLLTSTTTLTTTRELTSDTSTTTAKVIPYAETIIDMIDNVNNLCSTNSQHDIAVVTTGGVHLYDNAESLVTGACRNMTIDDLFAGYSTLPDVTTWSALLTYTNTYFDLFTNFDDQVYRWQKNSGDILQVSGYPKTKGDYIQTSVYQTATNLFSNVQWGVYRGHGAHALFFGESSTIRYYRNQSPHEGIFYKNDTSGTDNNQRPINPWYQLPDNIVAMTGQENSNRYLVVDGHLNVYFYELTDPDDFNTRPPVCALQGKLKL